MLNKVSNMMVQMLIDKKIVDEDKREVYLYGAMLLLSTVAGILSMFLISVIFFDFITFFVFLVFFIPLRLFAGGYHCNKYSSCFIVSNILFILIVLCAKATYSYVLTPIIASLITLITVIAFSPVTNRSNPLSKRRKLINRKKSIFIIVLECVVINLINIVQVNHFEYYNCVAAYSIFSISVLMIIEIIKERRTKNA